METGLNASTYKQPIMVATATTLALAFSPVSIQTQRTQRKRLRLDGNLA